jgi:hypothetical protein
VQAPTVASYKRRRYRAAANQNGLVNVAHFDSATEKLKKSVERHKSGTHPEALAVEVLSTCKAAVYKYSIALNPQSHNASHEMSPHVAVDAE